MNRYHENQELRGMCRVHDCQGWQGGVHFDVAKPDESFSFRERDQYSRERLTACGGGVGCNDFVLRNQ